MVESDPRSAESVVLRMSDRIASRGPDGSGCWHDGKMVALAHRRLSILDLSQRGHQPMTCHTGRYILIFNGEIYNFEDLRREMEVGGNAPRWHGHSDTEVLLAGFVVWGIRSTLMKCVGMFALAVWDILERSLTLARDRMGEKPLYYGWQGNAERKAFLFGSDLKALKAHPSFDGEIDRDSLSMLLRSNQVQTPRSIYKGISKLEQGHTLVLYPDRMHFVKEPYWCLLDVVSNEARRVGAASISDTVSEMELLLKTAVRQQMVADVPVGAFLSGGIDSSLIVALMQAQSSRPVSTFTIGFHESGYDEAVHAKAIARHYGTEHTELYVTHEQARDVIPDMANLYSEPFSDPSQIPTFLLSRLARKRVKVALTGDAGDELFGGYDRYMAVSDLLRVMKWMPEARKKSLSSLVNLLPKAFNPDPCSKPRLANIFNELRGGYRFLRLNNRKDLYSSMITHWSRTEDAVIGTRPDDEMNDALEGRLSLFHDMEYMMIKDLLSYLPDDILVKVDRAAMGVGLETRIPFLDHRVVEYAVNLPVQMKFRNGSGKWILRQILRNYLPDTLFKRPKMGFNIPLDIWLRGPLRDWAESLLSESRLKNEGYFHHKPIRLKWDEHVSGKGNWPNQIWNVLMFQAWLDAQRSIPSVECGV